MVVVVGYCTSNITWIRPSDEGLSEFFMRIAFGGLVLVPDGFLVKFAKWRNTS
jgi:hypothetical protein